MLHRGSRSETQLSCRACRSSQPISRLLEDPDEPPTRYVLACVRCDSVIRLHRARPRVPLCAKCKRAASNPDRDTNWSYR